MFRRSNRFNKFKKAKSATEQDPLKFYSIFNPHTLEAPITPKKGQWIQVAAIDPAIKNLGIRVERWYSDNTIETIEYSHTDLTIPYDKKNVSTIGQENFYYTNSCHLLKDICKKYLEDCHYIVIESQLSFAYDNVRIQSHITCALCIFLKDIGNRPIIIEMDPKLKTRLLGAPAMKDGKKIKQWAIEKACEFFTEEGDLESLQFIKDLAKLRKSDDIADAKCYLKALEILYESGTLPKIHKRKNKIIFDEEEKKPHKNKIIFEDDEDEKTKKDKDEKNKDKDEKNKDKDEKNKDKDEKNKDKDEKNKDKDEKNKDKDEKIKKYKD